MSLYLDFRNKGVSVVYKVLTIFILWLLSGQNAWAENNQQLADIVATNPKAEIQTITSNMAVVIPDLPTSFSQTSWGAGIDRETQDEARIALLVTQVRDAEQTLKKVEIYKQQYAYVFKHRNDGVANAKLWLMRVGGAIYQMKKHAKMFEQRMQYLKKVLPQTIKNTANALDVAATQEKPVLRLRLQTKVQCYQVLGLPKDIEIQHIQSEYLQDKYML